MRKMLLSFKPEVFTRIQSGEKIFEHRKVFPNEKIIAYLYLSKPVQAISGILLLDKRIEISSWLSIYSNDKDAVKRIQDYLCNNKYAMRILEYKETNSISLQDLRENIPEFIIPQMYYYINEDSKLNNYINTHLFETGNSIINNFDSITSDMICTH